MSYVMIAEYNIQYCIVYLCYTSASHSYNSKISVHCSHYVKIALIGLKFTVIFMNFILKISFWYISVIENDINPLVVCPISYPMVFDIHCLCCHFDFSLVVTNEYQIPGLLPIGCASCSWVGPSGCNSYSIYILECLCEILWNVS